ncbi:hypothetical protein PRNP1_000388 [Phytophthora ramorum]
MKFPLAQAPFAPLSLCDGDKKAVVELADLFVQQTLGDYEAHLDVQHGIVDEVRWKMVKRFEDVVVYQDREAMRSRRLTRSGSESGSSYEESETPKDMQKLLWFGTVQGTLDDIIVPKMLHHMSPLTCTVVQTSVVVCTPCMRTVLSTTCLDAAQAEVGRDSRHRGELHDGSSIKDTSSPSSSASSHAW